MRRMRLRRGCQGQGQGGGQQLAAEALQEAVELLRAAAFLHWEAAVGLDPSAAGVVASWAWTILAGIYLCHACSDHDIEDGNLESVHPGCDLPMSHLF
eukprot:COSAG01_NODE_19253_length_1021_cov_3.887202_2_plen_98_part_00